MEHHEFEALLKRIRQLLAKAESTIFEAEAFAFTAKAQELMTRHAIDAVMLKDSQRAPIHEPVTKRVVLDAPYVDAKAYLLQVIAGASRCQAVQHVGASASSVVGFPDDIAAVELLFTSLLVQAQTALTELGRRAPSGSNARSRGFRSAFYRGFAHRIGGRLREINDMLYAEAQAQHGGALLPALRSRTEQVDAAFAAHFPGVTTFRRRGLTDQAGWAGGQAAADDARLAAGMFERRTA